MISRPEPVKIDEKQEIKNFAANLYSYRVNKGITQKNLGKKTGINFNYLGKMERSGTNPGLIHLLKIAKALNISIKDLVNF